MRILGIDPGYGILGWSIIESNMQMVDYGTIETPKNTALDERLFSVYTELCSIIDRYKPESAAIEKLFFSKNTSTAMQVAGVVGVILLLFRQRALPYCEYAPVQIKKAITTYGRADKLQMQKMVQKLLNLKEMPTPDDAADAVAISLCHAFNVKDYKTKRAYGTGRIHI